MKNKIKKYIYFFSPLVLMVFNTFIMFFGHSLFFEFISFLISRILFAFLIINLCIIIFNSENRKKYFFHIGFGIIEFLILHLTLTLIISTVVWYKRDKVLLSIIGIDDLKFILVFIDIFFSIMMISYIIVLILNVRKSFRINKKIWLLLLPAKYYILFFFFMFFGGGFEMLCTWDILADTEYSNTFNIYNLDKTEEGMTREQIDLLIGEPLTTYINKEGIEELQYTSDGKSKFKDYAWVYIQLDFKDNILIKKKVRMMHD